MNTQLYVIPEAISEHRDVSDYANVIALPKRIRDGVQEAFAYEWTTANDGSNALATNTPSQPTDLPGARQWSMRLVHALAEVLAGARSSNQLTRWLTPEVMGQVNRLVGRSVATRYQVRSVHVYETGAGVIEVSAVLSDPKRSYALAMRLDGSLGRWRATCLVWGH